MPNLVPPKIPDGERVDFDVSGGSGWSEPGWGGDQSFHTSDRVPDLVGCEQAVVGRMVQVQALSQASTFCIEPTHFMGAAGSQAGSPHRTSTGSAWRRT